MAANVEDALALEERLSRCWGFLGLLEGGVLVAEKLEARINRSQYHSLLVSKRAQFVSKEFFFGAFSQYALLELSRLDFLEKGTLRL